MKNKGEKMVPRKTFNRNRIIFVIFVIALALAYPRINAWVHTGNRLESGKAFIAGIVSSVSSTSAVTSGRNAYNHAYALITGSSVAAEAEAKADAGGKGTGSH